MNYTNLIQYIDNLIIHKEDRDLYESLLSLPKPVYIEILYNLASGSLSINDLRQYYAKLRYHVYDEQPTPEVDLVEQYKAKLTNTAYAYKEPYDLTPYQVRLATINKDYKRLDPEDLNNLFITVNNYKTHTIVYDDIKLDAEDRDFMHYHGIDATTMKKLKMLNTYCTLRTDTIRKDDEV